jgi:hypothetical protein
MTDRAPQSSNLSNATVAVLNVGASGNVDTSTPSAPVQAIVLTNPGLIAGASPGSIKFTRLRI